LIDNSTDSRDLAATLVDLALRGHLGLRQEDERAAGAPGEWLLECRTPARGWDRLPPHERELLASLFAGGERTSVPAARVRSLSGPALIAFRNAVFRRLKQRGYYLRRPDLVRAFYQALGVLVALLGFPARGAFYNWFGAHDHVTLGAAVLSGIVLVVWGRYMPARTLAGARACEAVLGLEEFLARVEADRLARLRETPGELRKLLPYAVAFGLEEGWVRAAADAGFAEPPPERSAAAPVAAAAGGDLRTLLEPLALLITTSAAGGTARRRVFRP
jgi:hypothetical protein